MTRKNENKKNDVLTVLVDLVSISSYGKIDKNHQIIEYLRDAFKDCTDKIEIEDKNGNVHLLIGVNHELQDIDNSIILSGHIDTVVESEGHSCNVTMDEDNLKGLGISDMKAFIATVIANLEYFKSLSLPVIVSITSDEETDLLGIREVTRELEKRNINTSMVIVGEPTNLNYYVSSRGNSIYVSIMSGKSSHSGTPELGINAIELQTLFNLEVMKKAKEYASDAAIVPLHFNGGKTPSNVVPDNCSLCFGIRTSNNKILSDLYEYLSKKHQEISRSYGESKLFNVLAIPPFERRNNEFLSKHASSREIPIVDAMYATEAGYFQALYPSSNIVIYGPGIPEGIHTPNEIIKIDNLFRYDVELKDMLNDYLSYINKVEKEDKERKLIKKR